MNFINVSKLCIFAAFLNTALIADFSDTAKQQKWNEVEIEINRTVDGLGLPIDQNIKKTVIVLNVLGFKTNASCAGHEDRSCTPWVRFEAVENAAVNMEKFTKKYNKERKKLEKKYPKKNVFSLGKKSSALLKANSKLRDVFDEITVQSKTSLLKLNELIEKFYETRTTSHDRRLYIHFFGGYQLNTLQCIGSEWLDCFSQEARVQKIKEYQEEMTLFTEFLIKHFENMPN